MKRDTHIYVGVGAVVVFAICFGISYWNPYWATDSRIDLAMSEALSRDVVPTRSELKILDGWGRPLILSCLKERTKTTITVLSTGPDGIEGTADDVIRTQVRHNTARELGEWLGSRTKEVIKGAKDGLVKKSEDEDK